jgi:hypothetical protein
MLWFVNRILQAFGWSIAVETDVSTGAIERVYPVRTDWRGFPEGIDAEGYSKVARYLVQHAVELEQEISPGPYRFPIAVDLPDPTWRAVTDESPPVGELVVGWREDHAAILTRRARPAEGSLLTLWAPYDIRTASYVPTHWFPVPKIPGGG